MKRKIGAVGEPPQFCVQLHELLIYMKHTATKTTF